MDFCQTFVIGASCDKDELIRFWGQKVKVTLSRQALYAAVEFILSLSQIVYTCVVRAAGQVSDVRRW